MLVENHFELIKNNTILCFLSDIFDYCMEAVKDIYGLSKEEWLQLVFSSSPYKL